MRWLKFAILDYIAGLKKTQKWEYVYYLPFGVIITLIIFLLATGEGF